MKNNNKCLIISILIIAMSISCKKIKAKQPQQTETNFYLQYRYANERTYHNLTINDSDLKFIYCHYKSDVTDMRQCAHYSKKDLKTVNTILSKNELIELTNLINNSDFMELDSLVGGAKPGQRHYSYILNIKTDKKKNEVVYQSFPDASPKPASFKKIEDKLYYLLHIKFNLFNERYKKKKQNK